MTTKALPTSPAFCYITPTKTIEAVREVSDRHLVLAHLVHEMQSEDEFTRNEARKYVQFYREESARGKFIICDNSAFELGASFDPNLLIELAKEISSDALVLPDYPGEHHIKTIDAAKEWIGKFKDAGLKTFFVPQSEKGDLEGWIESYLWALHNPDIDIIGWSILGIPNALPHIPAAYARVVMAQILQDRGIFDVDMPTKYNHFLGLNAGPNLEMIPLLKMGILNSCDSSGPVWSAIHGHVYNDVYESGMAVVKKELPPVDFFNHISEYDGYGTLHHVKSNIQYVEKIFNKYRIAENPVMQWTNKQLETLGE